MCSYNSPAVPGSLYILSSDVSFHYHLYSKCDFLLFYRFMMELTSLPKFLWTNDNRFLHHHFPDILATVHTTQDIPEETVFGPCMLQNTLLDTVAFIALKCCDRRTIHYVFKVGKSNA